MRRSILLPVLFLAGACSSPSSPAAQSGDASTDAPVDGPSGDAPGDSPAGDSPSDSPASAACGTCPTSAPVCYQVNAHDGSHIVSAQCIPMPGACAATPTCDCARNALGAAWNADVGGDPDAGIPPPCPGAGPLYCDGTEGPLTIRCDPP